MWYEYNQIPKFKSQFHGIKFTDSFKHLLNDSSLKAVVIGNPGRVEGWMCECGVKLNFDEQGIGRCKTCTLVYEKINEVTVKNKV